MQIFSVFEMEPTSSVYENSNFRFKLLSTLKGENKDISKASARDIPYLPPEIITNIAQQLLNSMKASITTYPNAFYDNSYEINRHNNEFTLLNLLIVFPYLLGEIKIILRYSSDIPIYIYNFMYIDIHNVYNNLVILYENLKDMYCLDNWLNFITCENSPFYNTKEGIRFVNYILKQYSNHQEKKIRNQLLCNLLSYTNINPIPKSLDNIIFNKLVHNFNQTKKLHISLLSNKEKEILLTYMIHKSKNNFYASQIIISIFKICSTKLLDILFENNKDFTYMHFIIQNDLIKYILNNYTTKNYSLDGILKYYLSTILKYSHYINLSLDKNSRFTSYYDIIAPILVEAVINKNKEVISLIIDLKETTQSNILYILGNHYIFNNKENLNLAYDYIINIYYKFTFTFNDLSFFEWIYNDINVNNNTFISKISLYKLAVKNIDNIHNLNKALMYKIYNYMLFNFNSLGLNLIFNKSFSFKVNKNESKDESTEENTFETTVETTVDTNVDTTVESTDESISSLLTYSNSYSNSIADKIEDLQLKNDIDNIYKYILKYYNLVNKCSSIIDLMKKKNAYTDDTKLGKDKKYTREYNKRLLYLYNVYNFMFKHKLYNESKLKGSLNRSSLKNLRKINNKFSIPIDDYDFNDNDNHLSDITSITSYKNISLNRKLVDNLLNLKKLISKILEIINKV